MHTLETILCLLALMACLGLLAEPIFSHQAKLTQGQQAMHERYESLRCSALLDFSLSGFAKMKTMLCSSYDYSLHAIGNPFATTLGGDSNHYE